MFRISNMIDEIISLKAQLVVSEKLVLESAEKLDAVTKELVSLKESYSKDDDYICQVLGKALNYPWYKDDQKNFPGATQEDGVCIGEHVAASLTDSGIIGPCSDGLYWVGFIAKIV